MKSSTPGITPGTGLGGPNVLVGLLFRYIITFLPPFAQYRSTPERTARIIAAILMDESPKTGAITTKRAARCSAPRARL